MFSQRTLAIALMLLLPSAASARIMPQGSPTSARQIRAQALKQYQEESRHIGQYDATVANLYESSPFGFAIRFPKDWTQHDILKREKMITSVVLFLSPVDEATQELENVNLVVEQLPGNPHVSATAYTDASIEHEQALLPGFQLLSSQDTMTAGELAHEVTFHATMNGSETAFDQIWIFHDTRVYVWTLAAPPSSFDAYARTFHRMLETFSFDL